MSITYAGGAKGDATTSRALHLPLGLPNPLEDCKEECGSQSK
jgi:hypothetical protein